MPVSLTPDGAANTLRSLGHAPEDVVALSGGLWSAAFAYRDRGRDYVVRFHERRDDLEKDRFAERWRRGALRTPHMVEIGDYGSGGYGIAQRVHGAPLDVRDEKGMREILPSLFAALDALRESNVSRTRGYGLWHGDGNAPHRTWRDALVREEAPGERAEQRLLLARGPVGLDEFEASLSRMHELLAFRT